MTGREFTLSKILPIIMGQKTLTVGDRQRSAHCGRIVGGPGMKSVNSVEKVDIDNIETKSKGRPSYIKENLVCRARSPMSCQSRE